MPEIASGLLEACDDRRLFGVGLWPRQRELLERSSGDRASMCGRLAGVPARARWRRLSRLWDCLLRPQLDAMVRPGEQRYAVAVATNQLRPD